MQRDVMPGTLAEVNVLDGPERNFLKIVILLLGVFVWVTGWYWDTAAEMAGIWWRSDTFAHGLVVLPIFAWLVWSKRERLSLERHEPSALVLLLIVGAGLAWLLSELGSASAPSHFSLALILASSFVGVLGLRIGRILAFPLLFLFFGVPIGEFLLPILMRHTADFTVQALRMTGIPVYQENLFFVVPNGRWSVVEACSGLRYLVASLMVGSLYAYLNYVSLKRRMLFMLVALLVPIVANWVRAYITVMVGYHFGPEFVEGFIHIVYGWVFFGIVIGLMFWIGSRWHEVPAQVPEAAHSSGVGAAGNRGWVALTAIALAIPAFPMALSQLQLPEDSFSVALTAPQAKPGWAVLEDDEFPYRPSFNGHRGEVFQRYQNVNGEALGLYIAYYAEQHKGAELVMHGNSLEGRQGSGWIRTSSGEDRLSIGTVARATLRRGERRLNLWSWYFINGRVVTNDFVAKGLLALNRIAGLKDDSAVLVLIVPTDERTATGKVTAEAFVSDYMAAVETMLRDVEAGR